jgi:hypothetical protein
MKFTSLACITLAAILMCPTLMYAVTIGQVDNFEDGTTQNWVINLLGMGSPPSPPVNIPTGGPAGVGDNYLQLTSTGIPDTAGSRLVGVNYMHQWTGNYIAAGITSISMDVNNLGSTDLYLRLLFADPMDAPPENEAFSTTGIFLPVGSGWRSVVFPVGLGFFTADAGTALAALTNTTEFRIFNGTPMGGPVPATVQAQLGIDNITAAGVPEPATFALLGVGFAIIMAGAYRRKRSSDSR